MPVSMPLDRIDAEILRLLQNDARLSNKAIAAKVGLAPSSVHDRVKRLWADGVLTGAHAEVDPGALGVGLEALFFIELAKHERASVDRLMEEMRGIPEVRSAHLITGRYDLVVSSMTLHHVPLIAPLLEMFYGVLVPGGRLCIADLDPEQGRFHADNTGVFHQGFARDLLCAALSTAGFHHVTAQTAAHVVKNDPPQQAERFSVFLISGEKP